MNKKIVQDPNELTKMAEFYAKTYKDVYFVHDLKAKNVIAVECSPAKMGKPTVERADGSRNIFNYQDLMLTTRYRLDENKYGERMVGYESINGNDTRLSKYERGVVPEISQHQIKSGAVISPIRSLSPFERSQLQSAIKLEQASSNKEADYEKYVNNKGNLVERFETFEVEKVV